MEQTTFLQQSYPQNQTGFPQDFTQTTPPVQQYYQPQQVNGANLNDQNTVQYANFLERVGAYFIDYCIIYTIALVLSLVVAIPFLPSIIGSYSQLETTLESLEESSEKTNSININNRPSSNTANFNENELNLTADEERIAREAFFNFFVTIILFIIISNILTTIFIWLYYAIMESSGKQATLGKLALSLKVTDLNGNKISFARATGRHFAKIITDFTFGIGYLMPLFTEKKQTLHDMIAGCVVVKK